MQEEIKIKHRLYKIISLVKSHQYFDSFVVSFKNKKYFARKYKDTPSVLASLNNYQIGNHVDAKNSLSPQNDSSPIDKSQIDRG